MSACAGSSTERTRRFTSCVPPEQSGPQELRFSSISPARSRWTACPAGLGFMSTQRRENRWRRTSCTRRSEVSGIFSPSPVARCTCSIASGRTASVRLATNSLQSDYRIVQLVLFVRQELRQLSPPFGSGPGVTTDTPATHGSSPPHIPSPSGHARFHPTLPRVPAG